MIVDRSASMLLYLGMLLKRLEYEVSIAGNAEEALRMMDDILPSLILTDIVLPGMSGIKLIKQIKDTSRLKAVPVVVLTSETDPGLKDTCLRMGCAAYLNKPVEPEVLYRTLQTALETVPRLNIRLRTTLKVLVGDRSALGGAQRTEYATAISEGGLFVRTLYPQPQNALTPITIFLQDRELKTKATVLYHYTIGEGPFKEPGMGMKFVEISSDDKELIRRFIRDQISKDISPEVNG